MEQKVEFETADGFLAWFDMGGKKVKFPYGPKGWWMMMESGQPPTIASSFYRVVSSPPYGAPKIEGIMVDFGGQKAAGIIFITIDENGAPIVGNRRRLTEKDRLEEGYELVSVTADGWPDRVNEPTAVLVRAQEKEALSQISCEAWMNFLLCVRDGVEMVAAREVIRWLKR